MDILYFLMAKQNDVRHCITYVTILSIVYSVRADNKSEENGAPVTTTMLPLTLVSTRLPTTVPYSTTSSFLRSTESSQNGVGKTKKSSGWFGKIANSTQLFGCDWPDAFRARYEYCYVKSFAKNAQIDLKTRSSSALFGYGLLSWSVMDAILDCDESTADCSINSKKKELEEQVNYWWANVAGFVEFRKCLKLNIERMATSCEEDNSEISQVTRGMAGLMLNLIDIVLEAYTNVGPQTVFVNKSSTNDINSLCALKTAEAVHITAAAYIQSQFYRNNAILCWDEWKAAKHSCKPECKKFAGSLNCLTISCPSNRNFQQFTIWSWFFNQTSRAKDVCLEEVDVARCKVERSFITDFNDAANISQSRKLFEVVRQKFYVFKSEIEHAFHVPFFIFCTIMISIVVIFIIAISLICLWYNGGLGNKRVAIVRYAKLVDDGGHNKNRLKVNVDETRSLTRDADDIEG